MVQVVIPVMESDGEWQMKLLLLACHSPPAVWPVVGSPGFGDPCIEMMWSKVGWIES